ncbi:MAG: hypothetical protein WCB11_22135, partial [Terriglobales bacterium]
SVEMSAQSSRVESSMLENVAVCSCGMSASLRKSGRGRQGWNDSGFTASSIRSGIAFGAQPSPFRLRELQVNHLA